MRAAEKANDPSWIHHYWRYQILFWAGYSAISLSLAVRYAGWSPAVITGYLLYPSYSIGLTHLLHLRMRRWSGLSRLGWKRIVGLVLAMAAIGSVQTILIGAVDAAFEGKGSLFYQPQPLLWTAFGTTSATATWGFIYWVRQSREQRTRLQLALREAELRALEGQINPHFLFNCLNSIRALVTEDPARAQDMITRLANIFRHNLHRESAHTVPLSSEIEVVSDYLALQAVRFEDRLRVSFAIAPEAGQAHVPPMLLQTLVENALKHGIAPLACGGDLLIRAACTSHAVRIEVENSGRLGQSADDAAEPGGLGLANTRERLRLLYGGRASLQLEDGGSGCVIATVLIPV